MCDAVPVPRTTVNIDSSVLAELKIRQRASGRPLGVLISQLLAEAMSKDRTRVAPPDFTWSTTSMEASVDLEDREAVNRLLDAP